MQEKGGISEIFLKYLFNYKLLRPLGLDYEQLTLKA